MTMMVRTITVENIFSRLEMGYRLNDESMFRKAAALFGRFKTSLTNSEVCFHDILMFCLQEWKRLRGEDPLYATHIIETSWEEYDKLVRGYHSGKRRRTSS